MVKHLLIKRVAALLTMGAVMLSLSSCHERMITDVGDDIEISFSWWGGDDRNERTLSGLNGFKAETGVNVRPSYAELNGFKSKMDSQIYSGTESDVMQLNYDWLYQYTRDGEEFYDLSTLDEINLSTYKDSSLNCGKINGKLQAIPYGFNTPTFIFNKTLLDSYGLDVPATWSEVFEDAAVLRRDGVYLIGMTDKFLWLSCCAYFEQTTGRTVFDDDGQLALTKEDLMIMLDFGSKLLNEKVTKLPSEYDRRDFSMLRMAGTVSWTSESGYYGAAAEELRMERKLGPYLTSENNRCYGWYEKPTGLYAISKETKHPTEAGKLLDYLINDADMAACMGLSKGVPISSSAEEALEARGLLGGVEYEASKLMKSEVRLQSMSPSMENSQLIEIFTDQLNWIYYNSTFLSPSASRAIEKMKAVKL